MTITPKILVFTILITIVLAVWANSLASGNPPPLPSLLPTPIVAAYETKTHTGDNVTVTVTPLVLTLEQPPQFQLEFTTHSVELDFDVTRKSSLADDQGNVFSQSTWTGSPPGGHHRKGVLTFSQPLKGRGERVTLILSTIANIPARTFVWEVK